MASSSVPRQRVDTCAYNLTRFTSKQASKNTWTREKNAIIFPWQFLKHPYLEIAAAVSFYPNENQFQVSGPLKFKRLQTQENPGKHFSSAAQWEGQICEYVYNGCEVISVLTQQQMMERDSGHTCTWALPSTCARTHTHTLFSPGKQLMTHLLLHCEVWI